MGYFPVKYDSRIVIYERKMFIRLATGDLLLPIVTARVSLTKEAPPTLCPVKSHFVPQNGRD